MRIIIATVLSLFFTKVSAQVYQGQNILNGKNETSYFIFSNQPEKDLEKDLEEYLKNYGKVSRPSKYTTRVEKIKSDDLPQDISSIDVVLENTKSIQKLNFFFLNKNQEPVTSLELKRREATNFVEQFQKLTLAKLEIKLAQENVKLAESNLSDAKKEQSKIEKSLESNLKDQEKLGKKLDTSPELLTKALSEKEEIVESLFTESEAELDKKAKSELEKASTKKEKEIKKIKKEQERNKSKLDKKENDFNQLRQELFKSKAFVKANEIVLKDAIEVVKSMN